MTKAKDLNSHAVICVPDNCGRLIGKRLPASRLCEAMADGMPMPNFHLVTGVENVPFTSISVTGEHTGFPNGRLVADPNTAFAVPGETSTTYYLSNARDGNGRLADEAPRTILTRQIAKLEAAGIRALMASELEFYLFNQSYAALADADYRTFRPFHHRPGDNDVFVTGLVREFLEQLEFDLAAAGIDVDQAQGEGGAGQLEVNMAPSTPLYACDRHAVFKHIVKVRAGLDGRAVTFMAKPFTETAGSGGHIHMSLSNADGGVLLAENQTPTGVAASFLAGVLAHTAAFSILHAPYANSYRRLTKDNFTPLNASWAWDNRSCLVRLTGRGDNARLEFRLPGADANPYFVYAGLLAAGLAGVEQNLALPGAASGDASNSDLPSLPRDLTEALGVFQQSAIARDAFGENVHGHLVALAREELAIERRHVTDTDLRRCFEVV